MNRRNFIAGTGMMAMTALAGCSGDGTDDANNGGDGGGDSSEPTTEEQQSLTHEMGESFTVGEGAQSIQYTVNDYSTIDDYIGSGPDIGETPDGTFVVVNLDMENVGDESLDISTNNLKLIDQEDRTFEADTGAGIYAGQDSRISAESITFDQLQPGLSVTRAVIFDVGSGEYRFAAEPAGVFSNADTHYVPLGEV
ncbi:DUF4352 domain-containing protein [Halobacterium salinarum]|uniref:DUF4352 domain-containing protein n=1 Tax=Halobacterium salinarum TaxID=2242 RepID=UPI002553B056|nr:DUF4352 domain-containing protein [Halobacterium salinarum]MDL0134968.1 DUF4352 domain-containing protein [Halobacterium salinarum]